MTEKIEPFEKEQKSNNEIERKFLIKSLPTNLEKYPHKEITQGYLVIDEDGTEVRLRQEDEKYYQSVKKGRGKVRLETEIEITKEQFHSFWHITEGKRIKKTRYKIPHEDKTIELDIYQDNLKGLFSAEIEFETEEESNKFVPPKWLGEEITEDQNYKNQNLAQYVE